MKRSDVVDGHRRQRAFVAERRVAVRCVAVQKPRKDTIGDDARHVSQLNQAVQPQLSDPQEIGVAKRGSDHDVGEKLEGAAGKPAERRQAHEHRVRTDVGIELRADSRDVLVDVDGRP